MEYTLEADETAKTSQKKCLNPCFGGIYSRSGALATNRKMQTSLNPCFGGIYSRSKRYTNAYRRSSRSLNPCFGGIYSRSAAPAEGTF